MWFREVVWTKGCTWIKNSTFIQKVVVVLLIIGMTVIWPFCLVRETVGNRAGDDEQAHTEELQVGMYVEQNFRAEHRFLETIDYVLGFDPESPLEGEFLFELFDEQGSLLYSTNYPYNLTPDYRYCDIEVGQRLHKDGIYRYRLTNLSVTQNVPFVVYSVDESMYTVNNCGMTFNGESIQGESMTRYTWSVPYPWRRIILYWGTMGIVVSCIYELEEVRKAKKQKKSDKNLQNPLV